MTDIVGGLRDLAAFKHDDFSIGNEAADEIESLRERLHKVSLDWQDMRQQLTECERYKKETHFAHWKELYQTQLAESQAREAKLREALE